MRGRLAVGDDDHLALPSFVAKEVPAEGQGVLEVGAVVVVNGKSRDVLDLELLGALSEANDRDEVAWVLRANQLCQRQHHFLGGHQVPPHGHREREVDSEDRCRPARRFVLFDFEVIGVQAYRRARSRASSALRRVLGSAAKRPPPAPRASSSLRGPRPGPPS